jgi:hypothetical protein
MLFAGNKYLLLKRITVWQAIDKKEVGLSGLHKRIICFVENLEQRRVI